MIIMALGAYVLIGLVSGPSGLYMIQGLFLN